MLKATDLRKEYSRVLAVDGISLEARSGRILGLLGPNGAGKTTTIRMLLNIIPPDSGTVTFNGRPVGEDVRNRIGYLPEERGLYRRSRVMSTVRYFASLRGIPPKEAEKRARSWFERLEMGGYGHARLEELSKGNQQKVQFVVSMLHSPDCLILDEPFSGLDPLNQNLLREIMDELRREGVSIIFSTHVMHQAEQICDEICLIDGGRVLLYGDLRDVQASFGRQTLNLEFEGDPGIVAGVPGISIVRISGNSAEVMLPDPQASREIISLLNERLVLKKFERTQPSLNTIFLETVRERRAAGAGGRR